MVYTFTFLRRGLLVLLLAPFSVAAQETWTQTFEGGPAASVYPFVKTGSGQDFSLAADGASYIVAGSTSFGVHNNTGTGPVVATVDFNQVTFSAGQPTSFAFRLATFETNANGGLDLASGSIQVNIGYNGGPLVPTLRIAGTAAEPIWGFGATGTAAVTVTTPTPTLTTFNAVGGAGGYSTVRVNFGSAIYRARVQVVLSASDKTDIVMDNAQISSAGPLPVELTAFKGYAAAEGVALHWATASELNNEWFEVQRKTGDAGFVAIGRVAGQGTTHAASRYAFTDSKPVAGTAYYRLRQLNLDGSASFSSVVAVRWAPPTPAAVYPNPTAGRVVLPASTGPQHYRVFNAQGKTLLRGTAGSEELDLRTLPAGSYFLELSTEYGRSTQHLLRE